MISFNTKATGYAGLALSLLGLLMYGPFQQAIEGVSGKYAPVVATAFTLVGIGAAYFGMPATVPTKTP